MTPKHTRARRSADRALRRGLAARGLAGTLLLAALAGCLPGERVVEDVQPAPAPPEGTVLQAELDGLVEGFSGRVGIYARNLETGEEATIDPDAVFPTASMVKIPLLIGLMEAVAQDSLDLDARLTYDDSLFYESDEDLLNKFRPGSEVSLWQLAVQMIVLSDNTASLWIQGLVGGAHVNEWLEAHGYEHTRVNSRVEGRQGDWEMYGWGQSTPREMARLLVMIRDGEAVSEAASDTMYRLLSRSWWPQGATSVLPADVNVAAKPGAVSDARSEVLVVNAPAGDYVLCIMTADQEDTRWTSDNTGDALIRAVSAAVYRRWGEDT